MKTLLGLLLLWQTPVAKPPEELLQRVHATSSVAQSVGEKVWPGWFSHDITITAVKRGEYMVMDGKDGLRFDKPAASFDPAKVALVNADDMLGAASRAEAVELGIHAMFNSYERKIAPKKFADLSILLWGEYPDFSPSNRVLLQMEATALHEGVNASTDEEARRHLAEFLGYRSERRKEMSTDIARYESAEESTEGLATYMEYRVLEGAFPDRIDLRKQRLVSLAYLSNLPPQRERERFYLLGMAEALLLDRLSPAWKKQFETGPLYLDGLLNEIVPAAPASKAWGNLLGEEERLQSKRESEGTERIRQMLSKGHKVLIELSEARKTPDKIHIRALNPNLMVRLTANHTVFAYLTVDLPEIHLEFAGQPVVYEKAQDAFWCMLPEDAVKAAIDGMGDKLTFEGRGFKMQFENFLVDQRGKELRIRAEPTLEKKNPYKPEFVKPKP